MGCGRGKAAATSHDFCMGSIRILEIFTFLKITFVKYMLLEKSKNLTTRTAIKFRIDPWY